VDFAASMIDGHTVGEVVPNSQSAKEISELWLYVQSRLSRIVKDPTLLPDIAPEHLAISSLLSPGVEETLPPPLVEAPVVYEGPERRSGADRRVFSEPRHPDRRSFGRRASDQPTWGVK
jgi:hypothetical protein